MYDDLIGYHYPPVGSRSATLESLRPQARRRDQIKCLLGLGCHLEGLAKAGGVDVQTLLDWSQEESDEELPDLLDDVRAIAEMVLSNYELEPSSIGTWFSSPNQFLHRSCPIDSVMSGDFEEVLLAADEDAFDRVAMDRIRRNERTGSTSIDEFAKEFGVEPGLGLDNGRNSSD